MDSRERNFVDQCSSEFHAAVKLVFKDRPACLLNDIDDKKRARLKSQLLKMRSLANEFYLRSEDQEFRCIVGGIVAAIEFDQNSDPSIVQLAATLERMNL